MQARSYVFAMVLWVGCSSAVSKPPEHPEQQAAARPPVPPSIPTDPMVLVPPDAEIVAQVNADAIENTPSFGKWRSWIMQASCIGDADMSWLSSSTTRAVFAGRSADKRTELLLILDGRFTAADRGHALTLIDQLTGTTPTALSEHTEGAFAVLSSSTAASAVLDGRLLVVGTAPMVSAALARTGATPGALYGDSEPFRHIAERLQCLTSTVCAVALGDSRATRMLGKQLGSAGLGATGRGLASGPVGLAVDVAHGLRVQLVSEMRSESDAKNAVKALNDWIWRMDILARLAGLTDVLDEVKVSGSGAYVDVHATLAPDVLTKLEARLSDMLEGTGDCATPEAPIEPRP